ncbi:hypothetical protein SPOG_02319 [Schizosaccharomyces cryophilus OY26]|uniref:Uncharacterized protein n=1 Tax=Schizosaccharomyces cryophilus (strain OY26 / ATCC MYA-4695 / CBS 11777 / NBRC 106824 / NRRL Y48691) TaxID=653667 RepID=S9X205_SCHCR|nr:uncharacterized protein SPOG_02319 [Schizosaccharomyces cryophilus OY26]EPY51142.1 hypothetical protein SPOG_02319 [Schizosaccharomyces cryophilus OY26]
MSSNFMFFGSRRISLKMITKDAKMSREHLGNENELLKSGKETPSSPGASKRVNRRLSVAQEDKGFLDREFNNLTPEVDFNQEKWEQRTTHPKPDTPLHFRESNEESGADKTTDINF